jgi:hypothetical protein
MCAKKAIINLIKAANEIWPEVNLQKTKYI